MGGDGLIGRLAGALRGAETSLAIVPAGRGNDFARVLGSRRTRARRPASLWRATSGWWT